ncbi:MAG: ABC transporter ATP-binding protein [Bacilli bacterium]
MLKLLKYLKPFAFIILIIIGLLFVQANCDLAMPSYMSDIVNVGIQQNGIDNPVPEVIRESEFNKITIFLNNKEIDYLKDNYVLVDKNQPTDNVVAKNIIKKYNLKINQPIYVLSTNNIIKLNKIISKSMMIVYQIETGNISKNSNDFSLPKGIDSFVFLSSLPKEQIQLMNDQINKMTSEIPTTIVDQAAIIFVKGEYKDLNIDINVIQKDYIKTVGIKMILIALVSMIASISVGFITSLLSSGLGRNLRKSLFTKVESFSNNEFDKFGTSSLITRTTNDIQQVQGLLAILLRIIFYAPILGIGGVIKVLATNTSMSWIIVLALTVIIIIVVILFVFAIPKFKIVQKLIDKLNLVARESLNGMLVIRAFNTEKHEENKFEKANKALTKVNLFIGRTMAIMFPLMMLIMNIVTILIVWVGSHQIDAGAIQVGDMMAFVQYAMQIIMAFLMITGISIMLPRAAVSAGRIDEVLSIDPKIKDPKNPKYFDKKINGLIKFENVSFKYADADEYVVKNISFEAKAGETTAFIGSTGCGKSTIINLIPRFYDTSKGKILIDGIDIRDVTQHDLHEKIGYVPQKGSLFSGTIESNLKIGKVDATKEELIAAVKTSQALDFIFKKSKKFATEIAQGGNNVSGGQKQRLSIARALIKKPEIYIFDDTFSALDFKTDALLRKALKEDIKESTILIVAQRINTIMNANQIIVLENGEIVGKGTHEELMKDCTVYQEIALSQLSKEELA